ncbi:MAG: transglycosylase domain-containing protein [Candidatus Taylorbacteria bacterium]
MKSKKLRLLVKIVLGLLAIILIGLWSANRSLDSLYQKAQSQIVLDRNGEIISIRPNSKNYLALYATSTPERVASLLLSKEDRFFYMHPGLNPVSIIEAVFGKLGLGNRRGSSTLNQQLVKLLLEQETDRNLPNKLSEAWDAFAFNLFHRKYETLLAYLNTVYFGNQLQGFQTASRGYFEKNPENLSDEEILQLLTSLGNPSFNNPLLGNNVETARALAKELGISVIDENFVSPEKAGKNVSTFLNQPNFFEIESFITKQNEDAKKIALTIDQPLSNKIREIVRSNMPSLYNRDAHNVGVVVLSLHNNEILSLTGSPDPKSERFGQQINMLLKSRQVASTIKPLVYVNAFARGLRPYTLINDKEYRYVTADGRTLYPKNYDGKYHGIVTASYALANSINVPAIKTLEFFGVNRFADFLRRVGYSQPNIVDEHQLGTALGTIPMTLIELTHFYTIFGNEGNIVPLHLFKDATLNQKVFVGKTIEVIDPPYIQLINKILSDRYLGIDQFGYTSDLNLPVQNYALKTGTSDDFRDSWVIGYTPDFIVGVWVGNADNTSTKQLSGQSGAGEIWSRVMQLMLATNYYKQSTFNFNKIVPVTIEGNESFGLPGDDVSKSRNLLLNSE